MWRGILIMFISGGMLAWYGGQGVIDYLQNAGVTEISCEQYQRKRPDATWLSLTDCVLDIQETAYSGDDDDPDELLIPLLPAPGEDEDISDQPGRSVAVFQTQDRELRRIMGKLGSGDEDNMAELMSAIELATVPATYSGLVAFGVDLDDSERAQLAALDNNLDPSFVIVQDGKEPSLQRSLAMLGGGLGLAAFGVFLVMRQRKRASAE